MIYTFCQVQSLLKGHAWSAEMTIKQPISCAAVLM